MHKQYKLLTNKHDNDNDSDSSSDEYDFRNKLVVKNPVFGFSSNISLNKNNNNNDFEPKSSDTHNSLLNILTRSLRSAAISSNQNETSTNDKNANNRRVLFNRLSDQVNFEKNQFLVDKICLNKTCDQIQFTLHVPTSCFRPEDIEPFKNRRNFSNRNSYTSYSSDDESNFKNESTNRMSKLKRKQNRLNKSEHDLLDYNNNRDNFKKENTRKTSLINLNDYSLNSLAAFNSTSKRQAYTDLEKLNYKRIIFLIILTFLINPLTGFIAIYYTVKSKRAYNYEDVHKHYRSARYSIIFGLGISILLVVLFLFYTYYYQFVVLIQSRNVENSTQIFNEAFNNSSTKITKLISLISVKPNYVPNKTTKILNSLVNKTLAVSISTSKSSLSTIAVSQQRLTKSYRKDTIKQYDRLSVLIDHELLKNLKINTELFQRLKLTNDSLIFDQP